MMPGPICRGSKDGNPGSRPISVSLPDFESRNHITQSSGSFSSLPLRQKISPDPSGASIFCGGFSSARLTAASAGPLGFCVCLILGDGDAAEDSLSGGGGEGD